MVTRPLLFSKTVLFPILCNGIIMVLFGTFYSKFVCIV